MGTEERLEHNHHIEVTKLNKGMKEIEKQDPELAMFNRELNQKREEIEHKVSMMFDKNGNLKTR